MATIHDGRTHDTVKIDSNNRMATNATVETLADKAADSGDKFNINTGDLTLTNATKTSVLYISNSSDDPLIITTLIYNLGNTTSGTGDVLIEVIRNPTAGDIVTNANNVAVGPGVSANQNFGSNKTLSGSFFKGASGETAFTDGAVSVSTRLSSATGRILVALGAIELTKGASLGINYTPPASNTSQKVQFAAACYLKSQAVSADS